jgi:Tol biopolymer transport system component
VYEVAARAGATPVDVSRALDRLSNGSDDWLNISANGKWLVLSTRRFASECAGWSCLALVTGDLSSGTAVRAGGQVVHPEGFGAVSSSGNLIVYSSSGGPHTRDLYAIRRQGSTWSLPLLLSGASGYAYNEQPSLSYNGTQVVFECGNRPYGEVGTALCVGRTDGGGFRVVLTPAHPPTGLPATGLLQEPAYAADGSILFEGDYAAEQIWRQPIGATIPTNVGARFTNDNSPCGLPDGRIASLWLDRSGGQGLHEIKVMSADGSSYMMALTGRDVADIGIGCAESS